MRQGFLTVITVIIFVLQLSFIPALRPFGVVPDLGLALVALVGLYGTASLALTLAVAGGLALDLLSGTNFGLYTALFMVVALAAGYIHRAGLNWAGVLMPVALVVVATIVQDGIILGGLLRLTSVWPAGWVLGTLVTEVVINAGVVMLLRPIVGWLLPVGRGDIEVQQ